MTKQEEAYMMRKLKRLQGMEVIETFLGGPSGLEDVGRGNAPSSGGILLEEERIERTLASPIPSRPSASNPTPKDKGKAHLIKDDDDEEEVPLQRNQRASAPLTPDVNPESALEDETCEKRSMRDSPFRDERMPEMGAAPVTRRPGKEIALGPSTRDRRFQQIHLKVKTIKLEEGEDLPSFEPQSGPNATAEGRVVGRRLPVFPESSVPSASGPKFESAVNLTSAEGKQIIGGLRKPDEALGAVVDKLRALCARDMP
ncbi:unnamed protein product [Prunus armeniaca]|uniref:Uncharacterized protein n=1 Tax=Prunus armeniaca TaxID=36596 RepID=A0A6J5XZU4_PRUAR|nr:unnamed protein product [Prunus armeniaca]